MKASQWLMILRKVNEVQPQNVSLKREVIELKQKQVQNIQFKDLGRELIKLKTTDNQLTSNRVTTQKLQISFSQ